ncbi:MAG: lipoyl synthase [Gammaproteobacteria bacterium]|nr:lipoyl synthase [Gammaproteobacteria bacterium]MCW8972703.1 lipoyl synthase [Gammaproteobacteria bacterium]MCW8992332.1 lipoyl synthase [Gammaproteobacteria bacterium]
MANRETYIPVFDHSGEPNVSRMPGWIRQSLAGEGYGHTASLVHGNRLTTVCEEAHCPNRGECWGRGTATFMLLGDTCTRACGFCAVKTGRPGTVDGDEPRRIVEAVERLGLEYVVLTSVNRDELPDGGSGIFAATLKGLRERLPALGLEVLTPDFRGCQEQALAALHEAIGEDGTLVWGHNVETVPSLYKTVRKGAKYERSLRLLERAAAELNMEAKSSLMLGLGETFDEVIAVMRDLRGAGVERLALGQYLRPTRYHLPVKEYVSPERFAEYETVAQELGFSWIKAGAMVRSSYHAEE